MVCCSSLTVPYFLCQLGTISLGTSGRLRIREQLYDLVIGGDGILGIVTLTVRVAQAQPGILVGLIVNDCLGQVLDSRCVILAAVSIVACLIILCGQLRPDQAKQRLVQLLECFEVLSTSTDAEIVSRLAAVCVISCVSRYVVAAASRLSMVCSVPSVPTYPCSS